MENALIFVLVRGFKPSEKCQSIEKYVKNRKIENSQYFVLVGLLFPIYGKNQKCSKPPTSVGGLTQVAVKNPHVSSGHKIPLSFQYTGWFSSGFPYWIIIIPNRLGSIIPKLIINQPSFISFIHSYPHIDG